MNQNLIPLATASRLIPGSPHVSTLHRWRLRGIKGVKLPTRLIGGRRFVDPDELDQFFQNVTAAADRHPVRIRTPRQREAAIEAAERDLTGIAHGHRARPRHSNRTEP